MHEQSCCVGLKTSMHTYPNSSSGTQCQYEHLESLLKNLNVLVTADAAELAYSLLDSDVHSLKIHMV